MKMKEASGCLLSFPAPMVPHPNAKAWVCSGGRGGSPSSTAAIMVGRFGSEFLRERKSTIK